MTNEQKLREIHRTFEDLDVAVFADHVVICGQTILRPVWFSRSRWMSYWEIVQ